MVTTLQTCLSLRELDNQGTLNFFVAVAMAGGRVRSFARDGQPQLCTREIIASRSVLIVRHPRGSYTVYKLLSLDVVTPENKAIH